MKPDVKIENVGGLCPVQAEGTINGLPFYFRARHGEWVLTIAETHEAAVDAHLNWSTPIFRMDGDDPTEGYMPPEAASHLIEACAWCYAEGLKPLTLPTEVL